MRQLVYCARVDDSVKIVDLLGKDSRFKQSNGVTKVKKNQSNLTFLRDVVDNSFNDYFSEVAGHGG